MSIPSRKITLEAKNLACRRGHRQLFKALSFHLEEGQLLLVEGQNGSGKTTLLKILSGLRQPDSGQTFWNGQSVEQAISEYLRGLVWLSHQNGIKDSFTARENLQMCADLFDGGNLRIVEALTRVGLKTHISTPVRHFSAGMKRRLALARLLLGQVRLWILDEPQAALDKLGIALFEELAEEHMKRGGLIVMTSHHDVQFDHWRIQRLSLSA